MAFNFMLHCCPFKRNGGRTFWVGENNVVPNCSPCCCCCWPFGPPYPDSCIVVFSEEMEEEVFGLDGTTVSLICGFSVLSVVLVIVTLGIIGFFIKVWSQIVLMKDFKKRLLLKPFSISDLQSKEAADSRKEVVDERNLDIWGAHTWMSARWGGWTRGANIMF